MSSGEQFYQFVILYSRDHEYLYEVNISEEKAIEHAVKIVNRVNVPEMQFDGQTIYPKRVGPRRIFLRESRFPRDSLWLHTNYPEGYKENFDGNDVTGDIFEEAERLVYEPLCLTREGIFFSGQQYDAFKLIKSILDDAEKSIIIIDSYVDERVLNMLESKKDGVEVKILTLDRTARFIIADGTSFNRQYGNLEIRASREFHDRFVIIDNEAFYHFGHSIKDLGDRGCMFSRIEELAVIDVFKQEWDRVWEGSEIII